MDSRNVLDQVVSVAGKIVDEWLTSWRELCNGGLRKARTAACDESGHALANLSELVRKTLSSCAIPKCTPPHVSFPKCIELLISRRFKYCKRSTFIVRTLQCACVCDYV